MEICTSYQSFQAFATEGVCVCVPLSAVAVQLLMPTQQGSQHLRSIEQEHNYLPKSFVKSLQESECLQTLPTEGRALAQHKGKGKQGAIRENPKGEGQ